MSFTVLHRFLVRPETVESVRRLCEPTEDFCWVNHSGSREQRLRRHTLRGVPARVIDLVLPEHHEDAPIAVEIGAKTGKYDDPAASGYSPRRQIVVRYWRGGDSSPLPFGRFRVEEEDDAPVPHDPDGYAGAGSSPGRVLVASAVWQPRTVVRPARPEVRGPRGVLPALPERRVELAGGSWIESYRQLRSDLAGYDLVSVVMWHWERYYRSPLERDEALSVAAEFSLLVEPRRGSLTLAEANRLASRMLYDAARRKGWRKLTQRDRDRHGLHACGQWVSEAVWLAARGEADPAHPSGCGEYTLDAAGGRTPMRDTAEAWLEAVEDRLAAD